MKKDRHRQTSLDYRPRVYIEWNTGTRIILSKKDKQRMRRNLKAQLRQEMAKML